MDDMPILERRRIEAQLLRHVYDEACRRLGEAEARALIGASVSNAAIEHGRAFAEALGREPTFDDFRAILPLWIAGDALEIDLVAADAERFEFDVTRCRYAEMYREMGLGGIGDLLSCNRDGEFCTGYNPAMKLTRTQTIMKGASHCDFRYRMEDEASDANAPVEDVNET